jgi:hypothetical protein
MFWLIIVVLTPVIATTTTRQQRGKMQIHYIDDIELIAMKSSIA